MARTRKLAQMREEAYRRADCEGAIDRHDTADVDRDLNQGCAALWDALIAARGEEFFSTSTSITTTADTSSYSLATAVYILLAVRLDESGGYPLVKFNFHEEAALREADSSHGRPTHYQLRRTGAGASSLVLLPEHEANLTVSLLYVPAFTDMTADGDEFDGLNGWEDYPIDFAAHKMAMRDEEYALADRLERAMDRTMARVRALAPKRDMHQARRVKDVRGPQTVRRRYPPA